MTQREKYNKDYKYGKLWREVWNRDKNCVICGAGENLTIDHKLSVKMGGKSSLENMRILCRSCNTKEGHKNRKLKQDTKSIGIRMRLSRFRENHPGYFTLKGREFTSKHPGYHTQAQLDYLNFYLGAK